MKVLVTGANGFVGRRLVARLVAAGHEVRAGCGPGAAPPPADARTQWCALDVTDARSLDAFVADGGDAVVHLAGLASAKEANRDPAAAWRVNAEGTARLARRLARARAGGGDGPLLLITSSADVYIPAVGRPHAETDPVGPVTPYAASKLGAELAGLDAWACTGLRVLVARPFPHTGPGQTARFWVPRRARVLLEAKRRGAPAVAVGDLAAVRDFLHVDDVVEAYLALLAAGAPGEIYNIASGRAVTLGELHAKLEALIGIHPIREHDAAEARPDARPYHVGDATKLRAATGWVPRRSLDEALQGVVDAQTD